MVLNLTKGARGALGPQSAALSFRILQARSSHLGFCSKALFLQLQAMTQGSKTFVNTLGSPLIAALEQTSTAHSSANSQLLKMACRCPRSLCWFRSPCQLSWASAAAAAKSLQSCPTLCEAGKCYSNLCYTDAQSARRFPVFSLYTLTVGAAHGTCSGLFSESYRAVSSTSS